MKNFNLCLITFIFGSFLFISNSCHAKKISPIAQYSSSCTETVPDDDTDPDWLIFIGHYKMSIDRKQL